jgi:hypothetical protein
MTSSPEKSERVRRPRVLTQSRAGAALLAFAASLTLATGQPPPPADDWLGGETAYPGLVIPSQIEKHRFDSPLAGPTPREGGRSSREIETNRFDSLRAEVIADKLKISWKSPAESVGTVRLLASQDKPGHWPARDWRSLEMSRAGEIWEASPTVDDLDIPVVYFVWSASGTRTNVSAMRMCVPREAGLDIPSRPFWPFVEGFESGIEGWTLLGAAAGDAPLSVSSAGKSGHAALLALAAPDKKKSTTIGTTRLRGSRIISEGATGVSLWARTVTGKGRARFTLYANAFTTNQVAATARTEAALGPRWGKVTLPFEAFPRVPLAGVDYFAIELIAEDAGGFLLDDVQWLGPWKED